MVVAASDNKGEVSLARNKAFPKQATKSLQVYVKCWVLDKPDRRLRKIGMQGKDRRADKLIQVPAADSELIKLTIPAMVFELETSQIQVELFQGDNLIAATQKIRIRYLEK